MVALVLIEYLGCCCILNWSPGFEGGYGRVSVVKLQNDKWLLLGGLAECFFLHCYERRSSRYRVSDMKDNSFIHF